MALLLETVRPNFAQAVSPLASTNSLRAIAPEKFQPLISLRCRCFKKIRAHFFDEWYIPRPVNRRGSVVDTEESVNASAWARI